MEHTDAGVHTVLVDVERPDEYHTYPGEQPARPVAASAAAPPGMADDERADGASGPDEAAGLATVIDIGLGDLLGEAMEWQERALCAQTDPEAFFPEKGGSTREAKRICAGCEVRAECLEYALENDERFGIWGGMSERERRKQRRRAG
jgi:WhiB family transcriptional regulator, redox-sensing transcriptional regulator